jgi:hypothetical protein
MKKKSPPVKHVASSLTSRAITSTFTLMEESVLENTEP